MKILYNYVNKFNFIYEKMVRYFAVALVLVAFEMEAFIFLNSYLQIYYVIAIVISFVIATVLNWYFSKKIVFKNGSEKIGKEIIMIFVGSIFGVLLQIFITIICVEHFKLLPYIGKFISMAVTFFWNFWFRLKFVFK
jgi:putative flippase GtrA